MNFEIELSHDDPGVRNDPNPWIWETEINAGSCKGCQRE